MTKLYAIFRHNSGTILSALFIPAILIYAYSCQSTVISLVQTNRHVTRTELIAEVDLILAQAAAKFDSLDRQDLVKSTIFNSLLDLSQGAPVNPAGVALVIGNILGLGAVIDNVRKRTHINTLKGGNLYARLKEKPKEVSPQTSDQL